MEETGRTARGRQTREQTIRFLFFAIALASIVTLGLIVLFLFMEGLPIFKKVSVQDFLLGKYWYPTDDPADFGIFALIVASIAVTGVCLLL
jgi:phosphate transport system permease protein